MEKPPRRNLLLRTPQAPVPAVCPREQGRVGLGLLLGLAALLLLASTLRFIPRVFPDPQEVITLLPLACAPLQGSGVAVEVTDAGCVVRHADVRGGSAVVTTSAGEQLYVPLAQVVHYKKASLPKGWQPDSWDVAWLIGLVAGSLVLVALGLSMIRAGTGKSAASARPAQGPDGMDPST